MCERSRQEPLSPGALSRSRRRRLHYRLDLIDACTNVCLDNICGDGFIRDGVEVCDDGNKVDTDGCLSTCLLPTCGDGFIQGNEECDDGNTANGDPCSSTCQLACSSTAPAPALDVTFVNNTSGVVTVYWVSFQCSEVQYVSIPAGANALLQSYVGHLWNVREGDSVPAGTVLKQFKGAAADLPAVTVNVP